MYRGKFTLLAYLLILTLICVFCVFYSLRQIGNWLVVNSYLTHSNVIVVLGGGGGSRLYKGIELYEQGFSNHLLLVDEKASAWDHIVENLCTGCNLKAKKVDIITNSKSTFTDAKLVKEFVLSHNIRSLLVVTDPYHTRRAFLVFNQAFKGHDVTISVVSSGFYGALLSPEKSWWQDPRTYNVVFLEFIKCVYVLAI